MSNFVPTPIMRETAKLYAARQKALANVLAFQNGAGFMRGGTAFSDQFPVAFQSLSALCQYWDANGENGKQFLNANGIPGRAYTPFNTYTIPTVAMTNAVALISFQTSRLKIASGFIYVSPSMVNWAWYYIQQLAAKLPPDVGPVVPVSACQDQSVTYVAVDFKSVPNLRPCSMTCMTGMKIDMSQVVPLMM